MKTEREDLVEREKMMRIMMVMKCRMSEMKVQKEEIGGGESRGGKERRKSKEEDEA